MTNNNLTSVVSSEESLPGTEENDLQLTTGSCIQRGDNGSDEEVKARDQSPDGRFLKFEEIGRGSFKTVYKGLDTTTGVNLAWCELQERLNKKERERFREEVEMLKTLQHSNIVRFHDYWEGYGLRILKNCDNIFITGTNGSVKIGDLGLATLKTKSYAKSVIGTPEFMSPELYDECYDESVDVYAFGMCMIEMATSEYPYSECSTPAQIYKKVTSGQPPACFAKVDNPELKEIIGRCIKHKKEERPTVKELLQIEFFQEDTGFKIELVEKEKFISNLDPKIELRLIVTDAKKRKDKYKENEAIQFTFIIDKDNPDEVAMALVKNGYLTDEDVRTVASLIRNQITFLKKEREKLPQPIAQQQQQQTPTSQPQQQQQQQTTPQQTPQQIIHQQQQTPQNNLISNVDQQTPNNLSQKLVGTHQDNQLQQQSHQETPLLHSQAGNEIIGNNLETPQINDANKTSIASKVTPLIMPLLTNQTNNNEFHENLNSEYYNSQPPSSTVPSSPDCLSPGSPTKQTLMYQNQFVNQQQQQFTTSIPDLPSTVNTTTTAASINNGNNLPISSLPTSDQQQQQQPQQQMNNQILNQVLQSYSCPETPTSVNQQQPNFTQAKINDQLVSIAGNGNNNLINEQLSSSTNSANSTIGAVTSTNTSTNSILPPQVPISHANQQQQSQTQQQSQAPQFSNKPMPNNLENLKQEKKLTTSISSNDLKVNIEQGLQAIFASSSCANTNPVSSLATVANNTNNAATQCNVTQNNNGQSTSVLTTNTTAVQQPPLNLQQPHQVQQPALVSSQPTPQQHQQQQPAAAVTNNYAIEKHTPLNNLDSTPELNGQASLVNNLGNINNLTPSLNDKESIDNRIYNQNDKLKLINGDNVDKLNNQPKNDRLKKRRFTIIPVKDDPIIEDNNLTNITTNSLNNNHCLNHNQELMNNNTINSSCSNSNTISSTSSLSKTSSTEDEPSSSLSGYSTPADSISQIKGRFMVTTIDESSPAMSDCANAGKGRLFVDEESTIEQLIESFKTNDSKQKERSIRFICLNYERFSKSIEFRKLDKQILFEIMDELARLYKFNLIKNRKLTSQSTLVDDQNLDLTI